MTHSLIKILLACDHAGFNLKEFLKKELQELRYEVEDCGCYNGDISVDYPDFAHKLAEEIENNNFEVLPSDEVISKLAKYLELDEYYTD